MLFLLSILVLIALLVAMWVSSGVLNIAALLFAALTWGLGAILAVIERRWGWLALTSLAALLFIGCVQVEMLPRALKAPASTQEVVVLLFSGIAFAPTLLYGCSGFVDDEEDRSPYYRERGRQAPAAASKPVQGPVVLAICLRVLFVILAIIRIMASIPLYRLS